MSEFEDIKRIVDSVRVVDTHEHLMKESDRLQMEVDPLYIFLPHYLSSDLVSAGMSTEELKLIRSTDTPLEERWQKFIPFWEKVENTGYAKALKIALRDLYGIDGLDSKTWKLLQESMEAHHKEGLHRWILGTKGGIDISINDVNTTDVDRALQVPVMRFEDYITSLSRDDLDLLSAKKGTSIHSLDDLVEALKREYLDSAERIVGIKIGLAYLRTLNFEKVSHEEAEKIFNKIYRIRAFRRKEIMPYPGRPLTAYVPQGIGFEEAKPLQDYIIHMMIQLAEKHGHPVQIHTGLQEGNENILENSNPLLLTNLFMEYRKVKFDIFHAGYPYIRELATLAKNFQNVYPDLCWIHIVSPSAARIILAEWLDTVPSNKILAFGGDYRFVEGVYGHLSIARKNVALVLHNKVECGDLDLKRIPDIASKILGQNARNLFKLPS